MLSRMHWRDANVLETTQIILMEEETGAFRNTCSLFLRRKKYKIAVFAAVKGDVYSKTWQHSDLKFGFVWG